VEILDEIENWLGDPDKKNVMWITGQPGSGKTAISSTLFKRYDTRCASFFVKRDVAELKDPRRIWRTIAFELAERTFLASSTLLELFTKTTQYARGADPTEQFQDLIRDLLPKSPLVTSEAPPFVVIDALDECDPSDSREDWTGLLSTLKSWAMLPSHLKLIVTSRDYPEIRRTLEDISEIIELPTGDRVDDAATHDISLYFTRRFERLSQSYKFTNWPVDELTEIAAGLFIWAKVAMDFVEGGNPRERLALIPRDLGKGRQTVELLYAQVLDHTFNDLSLKERRRLEAILAAVVLAYNPLSCKDIKELMGLSDSEDLIEESIGQLKAVVYISKLDRSLRVCHKSFSDFMADPETPVEARKIHDYAPNCYGTVTLGCLRVLNSKLKFNICKIGTSYFSHHRMVDQSMLAHYIPSCLQYASFYWSSHLAEMNKDDGSYLDVVQQSRIFLENHFLYWLEVIGLVGAADKATEILLLAAKVFQVSGCVFYWLIFC
jgi:hypothetical protein